MSVKDAVIDYFGAFATGFKVATSNPMPGDASPMVGLGDKYRPEVATYYAKGYHFGIAQNIAAISWSDKFNWPEEQEWFNTNTNKGATK